MASNLGYSNDLFSAKKDGRDISLIEIDPPMAR